MAMVGGDWSTGESFSDSLHYRLPTIEVRDAKASLGQARVDLTIPAAGVSEEEEEPPETPEGLGTARIPLSEVGSWPSYTPVIQGFGVRTDVTQDVDFPADYNSAHGYALGRITVELGVPVREETEILVPVLLQFVPGDTGEQILDRPQMNASIPYARFEGWVDVGVVGHQREGTSVPVQAVGTHPYSPPYSLQEATSLAMDFGRGRIALWQGLSFEANPGAEGDYIRGIGAEVLGDDDIDSVRLDLTNSSVYELGPFSYSIGGELSLVDLGRGAQIFLRTREGEATIGDWVP